MYAETMRSSLLILTLSFAVNLAASGQRKEQTPDEKLFDKAFEFYNDEELDSALLIFRQFKELYPDSKLFPKAEYNIGYVQKEQGKTEEAKSVFKGILTSDFNEKDPGGSGLMGEQYALYRHFSCEQLADIYIKENNFKEGERYVRMFDKVYPYEHFCGNELTAYQILKARTYAKVYAGQNLIDKAINQLLPFTFYNGLANNDTLVKELTELLEKRYPQDRIKKEIRFSLATLKINNPRGDSFATMELFSKTVKVYDEILFRNITADYAENIKLDDLTRYKNAILANELFKRYSQD
jgi:hypothetical protein